MLRQPLSRQTLFKNKPHLHPMLHMLERYLLSASEQCDARGTGCSPMGLRTPFSDLEFGGKGLPPAFGAPLGGLSLFLVPSD